MSEEQTYLLQQARLKAIRDANQAQNGIAKPAEPARKPMTEEEIDMGWANNDVCCYGSFSDGIRYAEKHHFGVGEDK